jgi:D-glycero-D-manno-heptose 1,7-bisphosphate phosphatase
MSVSCVFLDRDGVINVKQGDDYVRDWSQFQFLPNVIDWIRLFNELGHLVIVVTNQRGIARGFMTAGDLEVIHRNMCAELAKAGARIDYIFVCPHERDSCDCRKPQPKMVLDAQRKCDIDLTRSLLIGDSDSDAQLARNCGLKFLRAENGRLVPG